MAGTFPLACPCAIPSSVCMVYESILWHIQAREEEMYLDNEMALQSSLCSFLLALYPSCL